MVMYWIESFPSKAVKSDYVFFADFDGHIEDPKVKKALNSLQEFSEQVSILGSFPIATVSG